jgi:aryl-alcohol dehydrogenase-like predicted oxidoreductase
MGYSAATVAIAWLLAKGPHILPIPGTRCSNRLIELAKGTELNLTESDILQLESLLPVGWAHGDRYSVPQWVGPERYS